MNVMYIVLGVLGLVIVHFCDPAAIKRMPVIKPVTWIVGVGLVAYVTVMASLWPDKLHLPRWSVWTGWALLLVSLGLLAFSLFINLPFRKTYVEAGVGDRLVTTGFYALVRHPGVSWTALLLIALVLVSRSRLVLVAAPLFFAADVTAVVIQDRFFLGRMFEGYASYRKETPMLIPNGNSIKAFAGSLRRMRIPRHEGGEDNDFQLS